MVPAPLPNAIVRPVVRKVEIFVRAADSTVVISKFVLIIAGLKVPTVNAPALKKFVCKEEIFCVETKRGAVDKYPTEPKLFTVLVKSAAVTCPRGDVFIINCPEDA